MPIWRANALGLGNVSFWSVPLSSRQKGKKGNQIPKKEKKDIDNKIVSLKKT